MVTTWEELENRLVEINSLSMPRNTAVARARDSVRDVRSGSGGTIDSIELKGPMTLLRVVGHNNRVYGGEWWFEESLLQQIERGHSRILFGCARTQAVRAILREALALSFSWNKMTEVWALELPAGQSLQGFQSRAARQSLFYGLPVSASTANRMLVGGAKQFFFPVKNPLWVKRYGTLS